VDSCILFFIYDSTAHPHLAPVKFAFGFNLLGTSLTLKTGYCNAKLTISGIVSLLPG
jgi:hypothetical protein